MIFPTTLPKDDPASVWTLQQKLLAEAELVIGSRDLSKTIYPPNFSHDEEGPCLVNTLNMDGAYALLSKNAGGYWPTLVYELAHETIHLLNPIVGYANWLEEGMAVAFSLHAQELCGCKVQSPGVSSAYRDALMLVQGLPDGPFDFGRGVRSRFGGLNKFNATQLKIAFPAISKDLAKRLAKTCVPR